MPFVFNPFTGNFDFTGTGGSGSSGALTANGSTSSPNLITATIGIGNGGHQREIQFVNGNGGAVTLTANPQIAVGTIVGQELIIVGTDDTNTVTINDGTGLVLNGACTLSNQSIIYLAWTGSVWNEVSRNDI